MSTIIQNKRGTAAQWTSLNPTLYAGEFGWESDTNRFKIGDGTTAWNSLPYASPALGQGIPSGGTTGQILAKNSATNYDTIWTSVVPSTSSVKHLVKLGEAISKGQAVYVSSANGTNMIVSKASNTLESTSSKTIGLLETGGATNAEVYVVVEGLLSGLDTSTANAAGDPVWLGTSGNLIYGLTNKPYAPAHLVFIGIVTRVNQNNGEIFIKPQNGFELQELHNVGIGYSSTPSDKDLLVYENSTSLWKNKSFSTLDLLTATTAASTYAPLASPTLTGTPLAPTATAGTNTTQIATTAFVSTAVANLVASAPTTLDTLNELAAALNNDASFSTTVTNSLAGKVSLTGSYTNPSWLVSIPFSKLTSTPTTLSGYGITDAATSTHTHGNITNAGAIGSTDGLMIKTTTSGVLTTLAAGTSGQYLQYDGTWSIPSGTYSLPTASSTTLGGVELFSDTQQTVAANSVTATASRTYGAQLNSSNQLVVNVPWSDTDTNYYPTAVTMTGGTTAGPTVNLTMSGTSNITGAAIPSASATASGIVTTGAQTFAGTKTLTSPSITTSLTTASTTFDLLTTNGPTINFGSAATTLNIGGATNATTNIGNGLGSSGTNTIAIGTGNTSTGGIVINIGTGTNSTGSITTTIGNTVKLPQVGTSGFVKLGAGGQLSADTTTYVSSTNPLIGKKVIQTIALSGTSAISFTSIPAGYRDLEIRILATTAVTTSTGLTLTVNGLTTSIYNTVHQYVNGVSPSAITYAQQSGATSANLTPAVTFAGTASSSLTYRLYDYTSGSFKTGDITWLGGPSSGTYYHGTGALFVKSTAAITQIDIAVGGTGGITGSAVLIGVY